MSDRAELLLLIAAGLTTAALILSAHWIIWVALTVTGNR